MLNRPAYYDGIYAQSAKYSCHYSQSVYYPVWKEAVKHINGRVLEWGCGTGQFAKMLIDTTKDIKYLGVDYSSEAIRQAKEMNPALSFLCEDIFNLNIAIVDTYVALEVLEHIQNDIGLVSKIPAGRKIIFSLPDFKAENHYRFFKNKKDIRSRYTRLDIRLIKEFKLIRNKYGDQNTIFLCVARKR